MPLQFPLLLPLLVATNMSQSGGVRVGTGAGFGAGAGSGLLSTGAAETLSTAHVVVTPGDIIAAEAGYLRCVRAGVNHPQSRGHS